MNAPELTAILHPVIEGPGEHSLPVAWLERLPGLIDMIEAEASELLGRAVDLEPLASRPERFEAAMAARWSGRGGGEFGVALDLAGARALADACARRCGGLAGNGVFTEVDAGLADAVLLELVDRLAADRGAAGHFSSVDPGSVAVHAVYRVRLPAGSGLVGITFPRTWSTPAPLSNRTRDGEVEVHFERCLAPFAPGELERLQRGSLVELALPQDLSGLRGRLRASTGWDLGGARILRATPNALELACDTLAPSVPLAHESDENLARLRIASDAFSLSELEAWRPERLFVLPRRAQGLVELWTIDGRCCTGELLRDGRQVALRVLQLDGR